jgi:hypothetical protein
MGITMVTLQERAKMTTVKKRIQIQQKKVNSLLKNAKNRILVLLEQTEQTGCQRAGTSKNKKVTENSTLLVFWSVGLGMKFL